VQGQLTDNSWLLYPDIKLTGGFAYVIWFKGEHSGSSCSRSAATTPTSTVMATRWCRASACAGTRQHDHDQGRHLLRAHERGAMAGGDFRGVRLVHPAWAEVKFGAHGIVYFDPFHYDVKAYARIAAGVTIDTWLFGEITFSEASARAST
jgi:hypothetical protein